MPQPTDPGYTTGPTGVRYDAYTLLELLPLHEVAAGDRRAGYWPTRCGRWAQQSSLVGGGHPDAPRCRDCAG